MKTFAFALACLGLLRLSAQCPNSDIQFNNQQSVDSFPILYPDCKVITGNMMISGSDIAHLNGLSQVESINGWLDISFCDSLMDLQGLERLRTVGEELNIYGNKNLKNLDHLDSFRQARSIIIEYCPELKHLHGLEAVKNVPDHLAVSSNNLLQDLSGLDNLHWVGKSITIERNTAITSLKGLDSLAYIGQILSVGFNPSLEALTGLDHPFTLGQELNIWGNPALVSLKSLKQMNGLKALKLLANESIKNLEGLEHLTQLSAALYLGENNALNNLNALINLRSTGDLRIYGNQALTTLKGLDSLQTIRTLNIEKSQLSNFSGLDNLKTITGQFIIYNNSYLTSFAGLDSLKSIGMDVHVEYNFNLSSCAIRAICQRFNLLPPLVFFDNNGAGCNSTPEVYQACSDVSQTATSKEDVLALFPNPSTGIVHVPGSFKEPFSYKVFDNWGRLVVERADAFHDQIDLDAQAPGLYFVRIQLGEKVLAGQIMLQ